MLERGDQLAEIDAAAARAATGTGSPVLVEGAAGVGKSALLAAGMARAERRGLTVLRATGAELERDYAFGVVRQLFEPVLARTTAAERPELLAGAAAPLAWLFAPDGDGTATRAQAGPMLGRAVQELVARLSTRGPLLVAVDDLHWGDEGSLRLLGFVCRRLADLPVVVLGALRPAEPGAPEHLLDELRTIAGTVRAVLPPLTPGAVARLVRERVRGLSDALCSAYYEASSGNPLYLRELLVWARGEGLDGDATSAAAIAEASIPSLGERLARRVARVAPEALDLAAAMAVLGDGRPLTDVAAVTGLELATAARIAKSLAAIELLASDDPIAFAHPVLRRSLYDRLTATERQGLHANGLARLRATGASAEAIAVHARELPPVGSAETAAALRAAARAALSRAAPDVAITLLRRALAENAPEPDRAVLLLELGQAEMYVRDPAAVAHLREAFALAAGQPALRADVAIPFVDLLGALGGWSEAFDVMTATLEQLGDDDHERRLEIECLRAAFMAHDPDLADAFAAERDRFDALADGESWPALAIGATLASAAAIRSAPPETVRRLAHRALRHGRLLDERGGGGWAAGQIIPALVYVEEHEWALKLGEQVGLRGREAGSLIGSGTGLLTAGMVPCHRGDLATGEDRLREIHALIAETGMNMWLSSVLYLFADAILERPSLSDLARLVAELQLQPAFERTAGGALLLETRGRLALAVDDLAAARAALEPSVWTSQRLGAGPSYTRCRSALALALPARARERALALVDEELALARGCGLPRGIGVALRALGELAQDAGGIAQLEESVEVLADSPASLEHARSLVALGTALRRRGARAQARARLAQGMDIAFRCGADRLVARADEELHLAGARPRRPAAAGPAALTAGERRVAGRAAGGRSNAEIGQELFLSPKTVESHLTSAYRKLGLRGRDSRRRLADALEPPGA